MRAAHTVSGADGDCDWLPDSVVGGGGGRTWWWLLSPSPPFSRDLPTTGHSRPGRVICTPGTREQAEKDGSSGQRESFLPPALGRNYYPLPFPPWALLDGCCARGPSGAHLSGVERYFCFSKRFSRPISCSSVKTVRLRRPFLALPPTSGPAGSSFPRRCSSSGRWEGPEQPPPWKPEPAASSAEPRPEQPSGASGNLKTAAACSAFSTAARRHNGEKRKGLSSDGAARTPPRRPLLCPRESERTTQNRRGTLRAVEAKPLGRTSLRERMKDSTTTTPSRCC